MRPRPGEWWAKQWNEAGHGPMLHRSHHPYEPCPYGCNEEGWVPVGASFPTETRCPRRSRSGWGGLPCDSVSPGSRWLPQPERMYDDLQGFLTRRCGMSYWTRRSFLAGKDPTKVRRLGMIWHPDQLSMDEWFDDENHDDPDFAEEMAQDDMPGGFPP